jgi:hypothetical protein
MPSIRELRDQKQRESFTGRQAELGTFRLLLEAEQTEFALLHIYGVGGVGKSALLRQFRRMAQELGCPVALVDMQVHFGVVEVLRSFRDQLGGDAGRSLFVEFDKGIDLYNDVRSRLQEAVGSLASGVISGLREGVPLGLGALAVDAIGEEQVKAWLYRHLPRASADLYLHGDRILTEKLALGLGRVLEQARRVVLMVDTYEQASGAQDSWLRESLLGGELSDAVRLVIAGRDPLAGRWHEWLPVLLSRELRAFTNEEARAYLERRGISDAPLVDTYLRFTERLPWALALVADTPGSTGVSTAEPNPYVIGDKLVERFLSQVHDDAEMRELVDLCTVVRTFDDDVVRALWGRDAVEAPMERLRRYSFVHVRADGRWSLNQVVRQFLDSSLRRRSPERWTELNRKAGSFYQQRAGAWPRYCREWNWYTLECLYHRLRLDEESGIATFASLFEEAKHLYRQDFCSELLNNVQDVELTHPQSAYCIAFYRSVITWMTRPFAWDEMCGAQQALYEKPDLPPALRARVTTDLGRYYYLIAGEPGRGVTMLEESLRLRRELRDEPGEAHVLSHLAVAHATAGQLEEGRRCAQQSIALAERLSASDRLGWGYYSLGVVEARAAELAPASSCREPLQHAREILERAREIFERAGSEFALGIVDYQLAHVALALGEASAGRATLEAHLRLMQRYGRPSLAARALLELCELERRDEGGGGAQLATRVAEAERLIVAQRNRPLLARLRLLQAEIVLQASDRDVGAREGVRQEEADAVDLEAMVGSLLADALLAAAETPHLALRQTVESAEALLSRLEREGRGALAMRLRGAALAEVQRGRVGPGQPPSETALAALAALDLPKRWALTPA